MMESPRSGQEVSSGLLPARETTLATDGALDPIPAGEAAVPATNGIVRSDRHTCMVCGGGAAFGFTTRKGVSVWTCMTHRSEGERVLVAPAPLPRTGS
jgi:hypothetical protein